MERIEYDLLFRWFVGLGVDDVAWDHSSFTTNRERLLEGEIAAKFLTAVLAQPRVKRLLSSDHFSVDGTLLEAWASIKSFRRKDGGDDPGSGGGRNAERDFHGETRSNETHASTTDPEARLYRKGNGQPAKLCYMGHVLMENRTAWRSPALTQASGTAERDARSLMTGVPAAPARRITLAADKAYDVRAFVGDLRAMAVTPHLGQNTRGRRSAIDGRTTRHGGYAVSQRSEAGCWEEVVVELWQLCQDCGRLIAVGEDVLRLLAWHAVAKQHLGHRLQPPRSDKRQKLERSLPRVLVDTLPLADEARRDVEIPGKYRLARLLAQTDFANLFRSELFDRG